MSVFNIGIFNAPRYSSFPWSHHNKISMNAGKLVPIGWEFLNTGEKFETKLAHVCRLAPMLAPTLDTYKMDIHSFAVRLRSLGHVTKDPWTYEDFFNLNKNVDGSLSLPSIPLTAIIAANGFKDSTLFESLGIPTFKKQREDYLNWLRAKCPYVFDPVTRFMYLPAGTGLNTYEAYGFYPSSLPCVERDMGDVSIDGEPPYVKRFFSRYPCEFSGVSYNFGRYFHYGDETKPVGALDIDLPFDFTLIAYIALKYPEVVPFEFVLTSFGIQPFDVQIDLTSYARGTLTWIDDFSSVNLLDKVYELYKVDSISVMKDYEDYLLERLLSMTTTNSVYSSDAFYEVTGYSGVNPDFSYFYFLNRIVYDLFPDLPEGYLNGVSGAKSRMIPVYPFDCYYKIIADWYINTALEDPDSYFASHSFFELYKSYVAGTTSAADFRAGMRSLNEMENRFWKNDYFTSAFPSPQAGSAVGIPVNGTIVDLRNANAMQKLKELLLYAGSRFRDVMFAISGKKTSAAILEMSEVIGECSSVINVDSVLQQSASQNGSPQAGYAGTGLSYAGGSRPVSYTAEEPTVIMIFASIRPVASYFQGLPRKFMRANVYDYAIPQLANVGEQAINVGELYIGNDITINSADDTIFGYTRRNGDWMWTPNEIHGDFRGTLDYWHNARIFGSKPSLSTAFLKVDSSADNLNRVFAVTSDSYNHFFCEFDFEGHVVRHLPKHVHYDL